jgi:ADP-ribose pyrophosphatase
MAPGFCTEYMHAYIATDLKESSLPPDEDENIEVVYLDIERIEDVIKSGEVEDSKSISALMMVLNFHIRSL